MPYPGTLTLPKGRRGRPGVVLVASGPSDRDVTTGPNKPFKDLVWGLATRGIAVVRFDKLTLVHGELGGELGFTMVEEYLPHIRAAVEALRRNPRVDPDRIFLVGHSGGGKAAVRAAAADPSIAGVAMLACDTVPLPRAALRVFEYLAGLDTAPDTTTGIAPGRGRPWARRHRHRRPRGHRFPCARSVFADLPRGPVVAQPV